MISVDPHRGKCWWDGKPPSNETKWLSLLDWSVYHAPGWEDWQAFRSSLIGQPMELRAKRVGQWWEEAHRENELAEIVRCVNVLRSLRGQFKECHELRELLDKLNPELSSRWRKVES